MSLNGQAALDWARYEGEILDLFVTQNKTLSQVMAHMMEKHSFHATERQYKYRFPNLKNVKTKEWIWIDQEIQRRAAVGKESEACLHGRPLPPDRVIREIARHQKEVYTTTSSNQMPNPSPQRLSVRTPPPEAAIGSELNLNHLHDLVGTHVDHYVPQVPVGESSTGEVSFEEVFAQARLVELDDAMEIEPEIRDNLSRANPSFEWAFSGEFSLATANRPSPGMMTGLTTSFSASSTPEPQFAEQRMSPFSQFVNLELFDTHPGLQVMTNLPWFWLQSLPVPEQPKYTPLRVKPALEGISPMPTSSSDCLSTEAGRNVLSNLLGSKLDLQLQDNVPQITNKLQQIVPERYEGELSDKVSQLLDSRSTSSSSLWFLFGLAAYFMSNNTLGDARTDVFLKWIVDQKYTEYLEQFLQINTPTIHAFAILILKSAVRIKNIRILTALLNYGVKFDSILLDIFSVGDMKFIKLVFSRVDPTCYRGAKGHGLLRRLIKENSFELARMLVQNGACVDSLSNNVTLLFDAAGYGRVHTVEFLLDLGANVNAVVPLKGTNTPLGITAARKNPRIAAMLLEHGASTSCQVNGMDLLEWSSLNCRNIYSLLQKSTGSVDVLVSIGDLVHAANQSSHSLNAYIHRHQGRVTKHHLERALDESIRLSYPSTTLALLQYGVSPDCHTLDRSPLWTALHCRKPGEACDLLIEFKANVNVPGILKEVIKRDDFRLLQKIVKFGVNLEEQGVEALVQSATEGCTSSAVFLLHCGVPINTPGQEPNPLQAAAREGHWEMVELLLSYGADINAPAFLRNGRTALQSALEREAPLEVARLLLDKGADIFAPPARLGGVTALEAVCHRWNRDNEETVAFCNRLLDLGAPINRPNNEPSSALHGAIRNDWDEILARILEPQRNAISNFMWCDTEIEEDEYYVWEPRTPTQLAAEPGSLKQVRMLLDHGADINEAPAYRFGRTALQAAASGGHMELVQFLFERGADVNAKPAIHGGITALQGAAASGNIILAKFLLEKGADVDAAPSFSEGRYAIEVAAEHGRLDMVQLLLNAGAMGNVFRGTRFEYAIKLAEKNGHFPISNLLENVAQV